MLTRLSPAAIEGALDHGSRCMRRVARPAVYGTIAARLERYGRFGAALSANRLVVWARRAGSGSGSLVLAGLPAIAAALRLVLKSFFGVELLIANRENELPPAVFTRNRLVFQGRPPEK